MAETGTLTDAQGEPDEADTPAREQLQRAFNHFDEVVHRVPADAWKNATPCTDWTVRDLVAHMTSEHLWAPRLLSGETMEQVGDDYDGDVLGEDPVATWDSVASRSRQAWAEADDDGTVHVSAGEISVSTYAEQMLLDLTVHAWDLARGSGVDTDDGVVPEAVVHVLRYVRDSGMAGKAPFGDEVSTDSENPQDQLVALLGRTPA